MIERLRQCNSCSQRARCELFVPGDDCYIDERLEVQICGRERGFTNVWMAYVNRSLRIFGGNLKQRKKMNRKREREYYQEVKFEDKLEEERCKISSNSESGKKQED
jgi:hypothetical protein